MKKVSFLFSLVYMPLLLLAIDTTALEEKARYEALQQEFTSTGTTLNNLFSKPQFISCFGDEFKDLPPEQQQLMLQAYLKKMQTTKDEFGQLQAQWQLVRHMKPLNTVNKR